MYDIFREVKFLSRYEPENRGTLYAYSVDNAIPIGRDWKEERRTWPKQVQTLARHLFGWKFCHPCPRECQYHLHSSARALPTHLSTRSASLYTGPGHSGPAGNLSCGPPFETEGEEITLHTEPLVGVAALMISELPWKSFSLSLKSNTCLTMIWSCRIQEVHWPSFIPSTFCVSVGSNWQCLSRYNFLSLPGFCYDG